MAQLPDVLDHLGKTPREFGALHFHFDSVARVDGNRVVARLLFQAAFDRLAEGAQVAFHAATSGVAKGAQLGCFQVPKLERGRVCRVSYPLRVEEGSTHVVAFLDSPEPPRGATRIRPAWKLFDTLEIPKLSEMEPVSVQSSGLNLGASLVGTALMGGGGFFISFNSRSATIPANTKTTLHKARELPAGLTQEISASEVAKPISEPLEETVWLEGQPLPDPPPLIIAPRPPVNPNAMRRCRQCFFEGLASEYDRARECPTCGAPWD